MLESLVQTWFHNLLEGKKSFSEVSQEKLEHIYAFAYCLYEKQKYVEASYFFRVLATLEPENIKFWKGLASSLQMQNNFEEALNCYLAALCLPNCKDPTIYVHVADCYFSQQKKEQGLMALNSAERLAQKHHIEPVLQHVRFMRNQWNGTASL